jgi:hypothetical protein
LLNRPTGQASALHERFQALGRGGAGVVLIQLQHMAAANHTQLYTPLAQDYYDYRIPGGFALLRRLNARAPRLAEALLADIGRSLRDAG